MPRCRRGSSRLTRLGPILAGFVAFGVTGAALMAVPAVGAPGRGRDPAGFDRVDSAMQRRVRGHGGGATLVVHDQTTLFRRSYDGVHTSTLIPIASASKWLTAATLMTLVDQGRLALDDPVARFLPNFSGGSGGVTIRSLLSHTSGFPDSVCVGDDTTTLRDCVDQTAAASALSSQPRTFHYSSVGYAVVGRIIEVVTGESFERAFEDRIAGPVGMRRTRFDGTARPRSQNPD
ncbi:MAG TPA: serine hydrolase domain-containing protein, partial [Acidimicrobiia bacterium]